MVSRRSGWFPSGRRSTGCPAGRCSKRRAARALPRRRPGRAPHALAGRVLRLLRRRCREALPRAVGRREGPSGHGQDAVRSAELPGARRTDQPSRHGDQKEMLIAALGEFEGTMLFVSHDRHFLAALSNRVLELTPDGVHQYGRWLHGIRGPDGAGGAGASSGRVGHDVEAVRRLDRSACPERSRREAEWKTWVRQAAATGKAEVVPPKRRRAKPRPPIPAMCFSPGRSPDHGDRGPFSLRCPAHRNRV